MYLSAKVSAIQPPPLRNAELYIRLIEMNIDIHNLHTYSFQGKGTANLYATGVFVASFGASLSPVGFVAMLRAKC